MQWQEFEINVFVPSHLECCCSVRLGGRCVLNRYAWLYSASIKENIASVAVGEWREIWLTLFSRQCKSYAVDKIKIESAWHELEDEDEDAEKEFEQGNKWCEMTRKTPFNLAPLDNEL